MSDLRHLDCDVVDELDGVIALEAIAPDERPAIADHLESCPRPHERVRSLLGAGVALASALEPVAPSPVLRERLMASAAATPQDHAAALPAARAAPDPGAEREPARRRGWLDWLSPGLARGLAAAALAGVVVLGTWNVTLQGQVAESERIAAAIASARAVYPVTGEAGRALLLDTPDGPRFLAASLETPPSGSLYVLWLIDADGVPVDVGVVTGDEAVGLVPVEEDLGGYTTFAVTVETARVEAPTSAPVLVAAIGADAPGS
jgi:anti-sigma-K factor RskA